MREKGKKKKLTVAAVIAAILILGFAGIFLFFHYGLKIGSWHGTSFEKYEKYAYRGKFVGALPDDATDFRFNCFRAGLGGRSAAAFTLEGDSFNEFVNSIHDKYTAPADDHMLTGKMVHDAKKIADTYGKAYFPSQKFDDIIDDNIDNYTVYYFDCYRGAGSETFMICANRSTGRIVIYADASN